MRRAAVGAHIRITGRRLGGVTEVSFPGSSGDVPASPATVGRRRLVVAIPPGAQAGRPRVVDGDGRSVAAPLLRVVPAGALPRRRSFKLKSSRVRPHMAFFDAKGGVRLRYRFGSYGPRDVTVKLERGGKLVKAWTQRGRLPYGAHTLTWDGERKPGEVAQTGRYRFKVKAAGHSGRPTHPFRLFDGKFPVRGSHGYGGAEQRFGAPRSGGRVHQGQDVFASCGTPVVAAWGGRVQAHGSDPVLYGNWVVIDGRGTRTDYRYAHFIHPARVHNGERIRTGERIDRIGKTGNAETVGCMLHFEVWPHGWERGSPMDPLPLLRQWDGWS